MYSAGMALNVTVEQQVFSPKAEDEKLTDTVNEIYKVLELYENESDEKKKAAYKIAVDEFEMYKNKSPDLWFMIEEKYETLKAE